MVKSLDEKTPKPVTEVFSEEELSGIVSNVREVSANLTVDKIAEQQFFATMRNHAHSNSIKSR